MGGGGGGGGLVMQQLEPRLWTGVLHLPVLKRHIGDFHLDLFLEALLSCQLKEPLGHLLINLSVPLAHFQLVVVFLPHVQEGFHFAIGPVRGPSVFLTVAWHQVAETIL